VQDADGHRYLDVLNNYTALVHGHAYPPIVEAIGRAARNGTAHPAPSSQQAALAELLCSRYPAVRLVRFTNSGSEAAILALRIARRATRRRRIVMFAGGYHGTAPEFTDDDPDRVQVPYNDVEALTTQMDASVAAIFVEPFLGSGGVIPATTGFLPTVQTLARRWGALFVLDEVQALRNSYHGMHAELGLEPDLVLMGKIIGGGLPVGALGGRAELMAMTAAQSSDAVRHSGTFNGNPLTMAAGLASMNNLAASAISRLNELAARLATDIEEAAAAAQMPASVTRAGSILQVHLLDPAESQRLHGAETDDVAILHLALLQEGVYAAPRGMLNWSSVMTEADIQRVSDAYGRAFEYLASTRRDAPHAWGTVRASSPAVRSR
jgi:glutamate-1-semialdehyde 2,1-aminomutase